MPPLAIIGGGLLMGAAGAVAGATDKTTRYTSGIDVGAASAGELAAQNGMNQAYSSLQGMVDAGPGQQDVANATGASRDFASMLADYTKNGGGPTTTDFSRGNSFAQQAFAPQQQQLQQAFLQQQTNANRGAALMGRDTNDPILASKLAFGQTQAQSLLNAQQGSFATNYAMQQPMQRLGFAEQHANVLSGLATQAMSNRQSLASMGESIMNNERNWRLQTGTKFGTQTQQGSLGAAISGGIGGFAAGVGGMNSMMGSGGFDKLLSGSSSPASGGAPNIFSGPNPYASGGSGLTFGNRGAFGSGSSFGF